VAQLDEEKNQTLQDELESVRERQNDLRKSIDELRTMMERSQREVGLDEEHFRSAISCALELLKAPPLKPSVAGQFILPKLDDTQSSWAETMDCVWQAGLAHFGSLFWPTPGTLKVWEIFIPWSPPLAVDFTTQASSCCSAFASCCVFYGSGRTRNLFR
jgi:hypothetical protein